MASTASCDGYSLVLDPALYHAAGAFAHHAGHHAIAHLHDSQLHMSCGERFHDDAADEARSHLQHACVRLGKRHDLSRIGKRPARMNPREIHAANRRANGRRTRGDQQAIEREYRPLIEPHLARVRIDRTRPPRTQFIALPREVIFVLAQIGPFLADVSHQQIRNRHARIGRFGLVANDHDVVVGPQLSNRFGRNDTGGSVTENDVFHEGLSTSKKGGP
jgi:hypothetical protein